MSQTVIKIACLQMNSGADMAANIAALEALVAQAAGQGAQLVATPENTFLMDEPGAVRARYMPEEHPGVIAAAKLASLYHIWLLIGSVAVAAPTPASEGKFYNRSVLINPQGELVAKYDKIHLFDAQLPGGESYSESARFAAGKQAVLAQTPWGGLGLSICYDVRFPQLFRILAQAGASIIAAPAAFTQTTGEAHWHTLLRARAIETGCFIIAPAQTGEHPGGRKTYGHALIVNPWGEVMVDAGTEVGFILATLDLSEVEKTRAKLPSLVHDRPFVL